MSNKRISYIAWSVPRFTFILRVINTSFFSNYPNLIIGRSSQFGGSIVIFIIGLEMVLGLEFFKADANPKSGSVVPIAFPLIAGSGTLTTIMSLKANYDNINILVGILINCVVIFVVLHSLKWIEKALGPSGVIVVRKFFGVILLAIAVKIFGTNIQGFGK